MKPDTEPFQSFRDDHQRVLERLDRLDAVLLERAATREAQLLPEQPVRELVELLESQFATHMRDEEEMLFPALAESMPEAAAGLDPLREEHRELRDMLDDLGTLLTLPATLQRDERIAVELRDFVDLLRIHVHKEEAAVFRVAARFLTPHEIHALTERIGARRARGPDSSPWRFPS